MFFYLSPESRQTGIDYGFVVGGTVSGIPEFKTICYGFDDEPDCAHNVFDVLWARAGTA